MDHDGLGRVTKVDLRTVWGPDSHPRDRRTQVVDPTVRIKVVGRYHHVVPVALGATRLPT